MSQDGVEEHGLEQEGKELVQVINFVCVIEMDLHLQLTILRTSLLQK